MRNVKRLMAFALAVMMFMSSTVSASATGTSAPVVPGGQNVITGTNEPGVPGPGSAEESTPEASTPEESTPEESTPEASTPEESTPEESTPEESTPEATTTEESTSEVETTEATTEEATTEEVTTEELTTEEATTEEMLTAEAIEDTTASAVLKVTHGAETKLYAGIKDAVAKMAVDFKSAKGTYTFTYTGNDTVSEAVTIPSFVTELTLKKEGTGTIELTLNATLTTSGKVCLEGDWAMGDNAILKAGALEVKKDGSLSAREITLSNEESFVYGKLALRTLNLDKARIEIGNTGRLTSGTIIATKAYDGDAMGDYTLCNRNELLANTINMSAGTFCNEGKAEVRTATLKDMINQPNAQLIVSAFTNTGKLTLEHDSILLMNGDSTVHNVVLGNVNTTQKNAALGQSKAAKVALQGTFTAGEDEAVLQVFVTNRYKDAIGTISTSALVYYTFETVALTQDDGHDAYDLEKLDAGDSLFKTTITNFPVDRIQVLPNEYYFEGSTEGESAGWKKNENDSLYQDGEYLKITSSSIRVYTRNMGTDSLLKRFSAYKDAVAYINSLNNTSTTYVIEFDTDMDVMGKLDLPTKAAEVILRGSDDEDRIILSYQGDIALTTDTTFENIAFMPYKDIKNKGVYESIVDTKGKKLVLSNVDVYEYAEDTSDPDFPESGSFKAIRGKSTTSLYLTDDSDISVSTQISGLNEIHLERTGRLFVTGGVTGVNELYLVSGSWLRADGNVSVNTVYTSEKTTLWINRITVYGDSSVLEIKNCLKMDAQTYLESKGTIKLKDVVSNCEQNAFSTDKPNAITITGKVTSDDTTAVTYVKGSKVENVTGYRLPLLSDYVDGNIEKGFKPEVITAQRMKNAIVIYCDKNVTADDKLANAKMASPAWFVINNTEWDNKYTYMTHKEGDYICADAKEEVFVRLSVKNATGVNEINRFATLQDAFTEIDRLGDMDAEYVITINKESDNKATIGGFIYDKAVTALNKNGTALADFVFPSKAKEVTIYKNSTTQAEIFYNKDIKLNCNVVFENVAPKPKNKGNIVIGGYTLTMRNAKIENALFGITGNGTNKGSKLIVESDYLALTKIDQVDTVCIQVPYSALNGRKVVVEGDVKIGDLDASYYKNTFSASGKMIIENIYAPDLAGYSLTLATKPKYTEKNNVYTNVEPNLTISGEIVGTVAFAVKKADGSVLKENDAALATLFGEKGKGLVIAKAPNAGTGDLFMYKDSADDWKSGYLYKQSGNFVYKKSNPQVELTYRIGEDETTYTPIYTTEQYENYADAIAQINVLKTKRDYEILFLKNITGATSRPAKETSVNAPVTLTVPNAGCVDTLTLTAKDDSGNQADVYFKGDITFNSNIILKDIHFKQVITQGKENLTVDDSKVKKYANPVNVKVNGAYTMKAEGEVTFNNAMALDGVNKATLLVDNTGILNAPAGNPLYVGAYIEGTVKNFALIKVNYDDTKAPPYLYVMPYATGNKENPVYKAAELNVKDLSLLGKNTYPLVEVGDLERFHKGIRSNLTVNGNLTAEGCRLDICGNATVKNNLITNDGKVEVRGNTTAKDVSLSGESATDIISYGQTFNITGSVTSNTKNATIVTGLNAKKQSALNIAGDVILTNPEYKIKIGVMSPDDSKTGEVLYLGGTYTNTAGKTVNISNKLLTAKKADINAFAVNGSYLDPENKEAYPGKDASNPKGYILRKSGSDINVHYAKDIEAALCIGEESTTPYNYYTSLNEAVAAIDAFNDSKQSYVITVLQDVGENVDGKIVYEKVNLPKKASKVRISSSTNKCIYYSNDLTLGCDTVFERVGLYPAGANGKQKNIKVNGYDLELIAIRSGTIGGIQGNKKGSAHIIVVDKPLTLSGNVTDLAELQLNGTNKVTITGNLKVDKLTQYTTCELVTNGSATITDYKMVKSTAASTANPAKWTYKDLSINGKIDAPDGVTAAFTRSDSVSPAGKSGNQVKLGEANRLLTVKKADTDKITFSNTGTDKALWAKGAMYLVKADAATNAVEVRESVSGGKKHTDCLDLAQAAAYVNARADRTAGYEFVLQSDITDTSVTDTDAISTLTLPAKDAMHSVAIASSNKNRKEIHFKDGMKVNGHVEFVSIHFCNEKNFSVNCVGNSDGTSILNFLQCAIVDDSATGKLVNITGVKNSTRVQATQTTLDMKGGITNVAELVIEYESKVTTRATSDVGTVNLKAETVEWCALAKTTIGSVTGAPATLGTIQNTNGVPQMTIKGEVSSPIKVVLYDYNSKTDGATEWTLCTPAKSYENAPLIIANTASADQFMAYGYLDATGNALKTDIVAYKNTNNYVYNGNISKMEVLLTDYSKYSFGVKTYAKTYAEAIAIINSMNNPEGKYEIKLRDTNGNKESKGENVNKTVIKTAAKNGNAIYGAFALPKAGKAKSLTIESENTTTPAIIKYTGTLNTPGKLELNLDNVILTEGNADSKEEDGFKETNSVTLEIGDANVTLGSKVKTPDDSNLIRNSVPKEEKENLFGIDTNDDNNGLEETCNIVFSKVTGKSGILTMPETSTTFVIGEVSLAQLNCKELNLKAKGNIKIDHIVGLDGSGKNIYLTTPSAITLGDLENAKVSVRATYTKKPWKSANTQLKVTGDADNDSILTVFPYYYGADGKGDCRLLNADEVKSLFWNDMTKNPAAYQKLLTASKLSTVRIDFMSPKDDPLWTAVGINKSDLHCATHNGSVYLTTKKPILKVTGFGSGITYDNSFYSWEQALKAIDQLNHPDWEYRFVLQETLGDDEAPVRNLTMPARAKNVTISAAGMNSYGILMTGTSINLRTDLTIGVPIVAVRKWRNAYYDTAYTMNVGKNELTVKPEYNRVGKHSPQFKLNGAAAGKATILLHENTTDMLTEIRSIGTVELGKNSTGGQLANYSIANGITGVGNLDINQGVTVESSGDVNVKNLRIVGDSSTSVDLRAKLFARNITVSDTLTIGNGYLRAGTSRSNDGRVTLNQVNVTNYMNTIEGKQTGNGRSQIQIKGTVTGGNSGDITIGLYYPNSITRYAQLYDGMVLLQAPKAADSLFVPYYATLKENATPDKNDDEIVSQNMGRERGAVVTRRNAYGVPYSYSEWMSTYGTVKSGNDIVYCKIRETEPFTYEDTDYKGIKELREVGLSIESYSSPEMFFATYEEAIKAIDRMELKGADGKYQSYEIFLLKDVEIGNEKGNHRYSALPFPSKASWLRIYGYGNYSITFTGHISSRCNMTLSDLDLIPVKTVKNEVVPLQPNLHVGNYYVTMNCCRIRDYADPAQTGSLCKVTGAANGTLCVNNASIQIADSISGLRNIYLADNATADVQGNVTVKELRFEDGGLKLGGTLTADVIYQCGNTLAVIYHNADKPIVVKGVNLTYRYASGDIVKVQDSVIRLYENGSASDLPAQIMVYTNDGATMNVGSKVVTGYYLDPQDWVFMRDSSNQYTHYKSGNALYIGN